MCSFSASEKVKLIGYLDLTITILTIVVIGYGVILPYCPYTSTTNVLPMFPNDTTSETQDILKPLDPIPFWLSVCILGTLGLIGILWSLVLVKTSRIEGNRANEKYKMLGYWLICNSFLGILLTFLWLWLVSVRMFQDGSIYRNPAIHISYVTCYLFRILLIILVWRERRKSSGEREMTDDDVVRLRTQQGNDGEQARKAPVGKLGVLFYSKPSAEQN